MDLGTSAARPLAALAVLWHVASHGGETLSLQAQAGLNALRSAVADCRDGPVASASSVQATADSASLSGVASPWDSAPMSDAAPAAVAATPRPPLRWSEPLARAAARHADAMARTAWFDHAGVDGSTVRERASQAGYAWRRIGENIAAGHDSLAQALQGWLGSPSHCDAMLDPRFTEFGLAQGFSDDPSAPYRTYWTLVLGAPR